MYRRWTMDPINIKMNFESEICHCVLAIQFILDVVAIAHTLCVVCLEVDLHLLYYKVFLLLAYRRTGWK